MYTRMPPPQATGGEDTLEGGGGGNQWSLAHIYTIRESLVGYIQTGHSHLAIIRCRNTGRPDHLIDGEAQMGPVGFIIWLVHCLNKLLYKDETDIYKDLYMEDSIYNACFPHTHLDSTICRPLLGGSDQRAVALRRCSLSFHLWNRKLNVSRNLICGLAKWQHTISILVDLFWCLFY